MTLFISDFADPPIPTDGAVLKGITMGLQIKGAGTVQWVLNNQQTFCVTAYLMPEASQRLLSRQHFLQHSDKAGSHFVLQSTHIELYQTTRLQKFPLTKQTISLHYMQQSFCHHNCCRNPSCWCIDGTKYQPHCISERTLAVEFLFVSSRV